MKHANPGEQVTLRRRIKKAEKAANVTAINREAAINAAVLAAAKSVAAEEALEKAADPKKVVPYDIAKAYNDAEANLTSAVEAENAAWDAAARADAELAAARAAAKAAFAI